MFGKPFYHNTMRKIVASFGAIFSNIYVVKRAENSKELERIKVPLAYGPAERYLVRTLEDPELNRNFSIKLPRMSFQIMTVEYDSQRKLNTIKKNVSVIPENGGQIIRQYQGVPYKIGIELSIISKYINDANQIVEQILPWFTPAFTVTINSIPEMSYKDDIAIVLTGVALQDNYDDEWVTRRDIVWTLTFDVKAIFYGPMVDKDIITRTITDVYNAAGADIENSTELQTVTRSSRSILEVTPPNATYKDEFGYTETFEGMFDKTSTGEMPNYAVVRDPNTGENTSAKHKISTTFIETRENVPEPKIK
jgi:hypothetical protein